MKNIIITLSILALLSCSKDDNITTNNTEQKNVTVLVQPNQTDKNYALSEQSHYMVRNTKTHLNKLLLFIGGSYSVPKDYNFVCEHGATLGFDVISLSYPNTTATAPLGTNPDKFIFDNYRDELCFGNQVSEIVVISPLNSIVTRTIKLLQYLRNTYPDQNWGQYLTATDNLAWDKITVSGHSQGSGHACYLAKKNLVDRVVMFAGPNDYHIYYSSAANWLAQAGATPTKKYFSLLHTKDEIVPFTHQVENLKGLGLLTATQSPILADNLTPPFSNSQTLSLNIPALSNHNSPIGANAKLPIIWTYLFTTK